MVGYLVSLVKPFSWLVGCLLMEFCSPQIGGKMPAEEGSAESESPVKGKKQFCILSSVDVVIKVAL